MDSITYITVHRKIINGEQKVWEEAHTIRLSTIYVKTSFQEFLLNDVHDVSYKGFSSREGILYLHTSQGVFPFQVRECPQSFINEFKTLKVSKRKDSL